MKMPESPPSFDSLVHEMAGKPDLLEKIVALTKSQSTSEKYVHWDELRYRPPPGGLTHRQWWLAVKIYRLGLQRIIPLNDDVGRPFKFAIFDWILRQLHETDVGLSGHVRLPDEVKNPDTRNRYIVRGLTEEAFTSSRLEGAVTTRAVAKEMIRSGRNPRSRSERMILNNYSAMQQIGSLKEEPLTPERVLELHRILTSGTLDNADAEGRLRREDENVRVTDEYGTVFHVPPPASQLPQRLDAMCAFANHENTARFVHPVIRSIILHFWLAYDHPFVDGNGRAARALFYWSMLRNNYWLWEFVSISHVILRAPVQYYRAFLYTETDDNDLTYFIIHQLELMLRAQDELRAYLEREATRMNQLRKRLRGMDALNHRQRALVEHALSHGDAEFTIDGHQASHRVVYQTARTDLLNLVKRGLLVANRRGKRMYFRPAKRIEARLEELP